VVGVLKNGDTAKVRIEVVCRWFPGWRLASAAFGATLSWVEEPGPRRAPMGLYGWSRRRVEPEHHDLEIACLKRRERASLIQFGSYQSKMCDPELRVCQIRGKLQVLNGDHQALDDVTDATYCTVVATQEGERPVQQGLPVRIPADVLQLVDRMTPGEPCGPCGEPTRGSSSWPTLGAACRARNKLPCVIILAVYSISKKI
jgi:hypothetical protein